MIKIRLVKNSKVSITLRMKNWTHTLTTTNKTASKVSHISSRMRALDGMLKTTKLFDIKYPNNLLKISINLLQYLLLDIYNSTLPD